MSTIFDSFPKPPFSFCVMPSLHCGKPTITLVPAGWALVSCALYLTYIPRTTTMACGLIPEIFPSYMNRCLSLEIYRWVYSERHILCRVQYRVKICRPGYHDNRPQEPLNRFDAVFLILSAREGTLSSVVLSDSIPDKTFSLVFDIAQSSLGVILLKS